ncbi:MAG: M23 family metallopeptidase [Candidatus Amulumruptor caecigallinarius]|nr:M23 family metallopeptidase [Candidatus Amulumruptor caecigallinarius]MCM1397056.1 M23 family metallopeptidase [Candidatus Amulumruptor caecigallinarius]MCM1454004.1 M23 family metallopeptidase [bacterium]
MHILNKILFISIAAVSALAAQAQTPYHLPSTHESQHRDLLASQSPLMEKLKLENTQKFIQDIEDREGLDDSEIFSSFWDNQTVNPYANVAIPDHKNIVLGEYVHPHNGAVTSEFGYRPRFGRVHKGIDIKLNVGDTVRAAFDGKVRVARYNPGGYGYFVIVRHDNGLETVYGHLKKFTVKPGQVVKAGDMLGFGGNTGRSTGPHLHLETRYMGVAINPRAIIDFDNKTTHKDVYAFDKSSVQKAVNYAPRKYSKAKYAKNSSKKATRKKSTKRTSRRKSSRR